MNELEIKDLLEFAASFDRRKVEELDVLAWHDVLGEVTYADAREAVARHYSISEKRLYPVDVLNGIASIRARRLAQIAEPVPDLDPDHVEAYQAALAENRRVLADVEVNPGELPRPEATQMPPELKEQARRSLTEAARERAEGNRGLKLVAPDKAALRVACPWCDAKPGDRCTSQGRPLRLSPAHPARVEAAKERSAS